MNDLKFAFRKLLKNPGFTAVVVLTLEPVTTSASVEGGGDSTAFLLFPLRSRTDKRVIKTKVSFNRMVLEGGKTGDVNKEVEVGKKKTDLNDNW